VTTTRVAVFIDYQNVYMGARRAFGLQWDAHTAGQVFPRRLGLKLKGVGSSDRELVAVRVYRGMPSSSRDPVAYGAADRQTALWRQQKLVTTVTRPLNYRGPSGPREKGIDVCIAVDLVMMAMRNEYDIGVLFSADTDLVPALEAVINLKGPQACEVAAWLPSDGTPANRLTVAGQRVWCHLLDQAAYEQVRDETDYNVRRRRR
jgi:hypothetical protein